MSVPTPLLDFFRRGEVARDVRLLAAQGAVAPRAHEQLSILILLLDDPDPEVRAVASQTMARIPGEALVSFLGRADVSVDVREFLIRVDWGAEKGESGSAMSAAISCSSMSRAATAHESGPLKV